MLMVQIPLLVVITIKLSTTKIIFKFTSFFQPLLEYCKFATSYLFKSNATDTIYFTTYLQIAYMTLVFLNSYCK